MGVDADFIAAYCRAGEQGVSEEMSYFGGVADGRCLSTSGGWDGM